MTTASQPIDMTAIILTRNEEANIKRCIESITPLVKRIIIVDSYSDDSTVDIAKNLGAEVYQHKWKHYADQFNWALDNIKIETKWIFRIDADECVTKELEHEIRNNCNEHNDDDINGFILRYKVFFLGRFLLHGGWYPFLKLTIFKNGLGRFEDRAMGEHIILSEGQAITLKNDCLHYDFKDLTTWTEKHNKYSSREVIDRMYVITHRNNLAKLDGPLENNKRFRDGLYYKLPPFLRAKLYFWYRYYIRLGFLDGTQGRIFAFLQSYWYRFLIDAKLFEKEIENRNKN